MEACIVRIMKARRALRYAVLLNEVIEQLRSRFRPSPSHIKKRIESLIDREFLERDENDRCVRRPMLLLLCILPSRLSGRSPTHAPIWPSPSSIHHHFRTLCRYLA